MWSRRALYPLVAGLLALAALVVPGASIPDVLALGQDVCPEPNDTFQAACYLGAQSDALGFISNPNDVDAYRIAVLDFNTDVHVEIDDMPAPYKVELANWNGEVIASSKPAANGSEAIDTTVPMPGSYYIFVHSKSGGFSDGAPYRIFRALTYPGSSIPQVLFSDEFLTGAPQSGTGESPSALHTSQDGRYTIVFKSGGTADDPAWSRWAGWGPELTDFTMTADARLVNGADAGFVFYFRYIDEKNYYSLVLDAKDGQARVTKQVNGQGDWTDWKKTDAINTGGGVNRATIHAYKSNIRVLVNGQQIFDLDDDSINHGKMGVGALAWGDPPVVNFDNILVTTPGEGLDD
ncbi:MAG: DUF1080 domain-containing protein [Chloroflexi bacterium]|nr:DUF1080 domain-containing protein [Chloroflexota bacterium]